MLQEENIAIVFVIYAVIHPARFHAYNERTKCVSKYSRAIDLNRYARNSYGRIGGINNAARHYSKIIAELAFTQCRHGEQHGRTDTIILRGSVIASTALPIALGSAAGIYVTYCYQQNELAAIFHGLGLDIPVPTFAIIRKLTLNI